MDASAREGHGDFLLPGGIRGDNRGGVGSDLRPRGLGGEEGARDRGGGLAREERAQGTFEYALTVLAFLAIIAAFAALWRAGEDGSLAALAERSASHALDGFGALDLVLF